MNHSLLFQWIPCPLCGADQTTILKKSRYPENVTEEELRRSYSASSNHVLMDQVVECKACGMKYVNPRPRPDIVIDGYSSAVDPTFVAQNEGRIATFRRTLQGIVRRLGWTAGQNRNYIDVGCAGGASLVAARSLGFQVQGIEPSRWMANFGRENYQVDIRDGILEMGTFPPESFDVLTMWDVLEHIPTPAEVLRTVHEVLVKDGIFIVTYPDVGNWITRLLGDRWPFWLSVHLLYYDPSTIRRQLTQSGFEVLDIRPYAQTLQFGYVLERARPYVPPIALLGSLVKALGMSKLPITYLMGQTLVVARKKSL